MTHSPQQPAPNPLRPKPHAFEFEQLSATTARIHIAPTYSHRQVSEAAAVLREQFTTLLLEAVPAYHQILIQWSSGSYLELQNRVSNRMKQALEEPRSATSNAQGLRIPVCYHPQLSPDLTMAAEALGLLPRELVERHLAGSYHIEAIGFMPGFAYLGGLAPSLHLPRKHSPRTQVPKGSVAIAEDKTAIYPLAAPGGWNLIGRSPHPLGSAESLVSAHKQHKSGALYVGQTIQFYEINLEEFERLIAQPTEPTHHD